MLQGNDPLNASDLDLDIVGETVVVSREDAQKAGNVEYDLKGLVPTLAHKSTEVGQI